MAVPHAAAIQVENLGKEYSIGGSARSQETFREMLSGALTAPFRRLRHGGRPSGERFWAVRDVSFDIGTGEVVGVIGRNGAGKSTLLKILARITEPTRGRARIRGRVASLLEVGTGFHPELSGRENVYLNGAILGMRRAEIHRKFDQIVAFAEVERFIDTPVKHYSSGMYVRLAFAVAAHLEPDILLVDEVLAVGDAAFQKKCLQKMGETVRENRTVLFVSHNMGAIVDICQTAIWLDQGRIARSGPVPEVVSAYLRSTTERQRDISVRPVATAPFKVRAVRCFASAPGRPAATALGVLEAWTLNLELECREAVAEVEVGVQFHNSSGAILFTTQMSQSSAGALNRFQPGTYQIRIALPPHFLAPGMYSCTVAIHRPGMESLDAWPEALNVSIEEEGSDLWRYHGLPYGNILVRFPWEVSKQ
jgi:lipopolysaccharide transport system ATP-binding protein